MHRCDRTTHQPRLNHHPNRAVTSPASNVCPPVMIRGVSYESIKGRRGGAPAVEGPLLSWREVATHARSTCAHQFVICFFNYVLLAILPYAVKHYPKAALALLLCRGSTGDCLVSLGVCDMSGDGEWRRSSQFVTRAITDRLSRFSSAVGLHCAQTPRRGTSLVPWRAFRRLL